jgi:hypothetical protein
MVHRFAALIAVLFLGGTATAVPIGTGTLRVEAQGTPQVFTACSLMTFANQTYSVFGHDVNLGTDVGAFTGLSDQNLDNFKSYPDDTVFVFQSTHAVVCVDPGCATESYVTSSVSNVSGSLPTSLGSDVSYSLDGVIDTNYTSGSSTIPACTLSGQVAIFIGTVNVNAFQTQPTSVGSNQMVSFPATTFINPLDNQNVSVDVGVTFSQVTSGGTTTVTATSNAAGALPANFAGAVNGYQAAFLDVSTTAVVQPPITVCSTYTDADNDGFIDGTSPPIPESALSFLHGEGDPKVFVDRTVSRDPINNVICAQVDSLSPFVLAVNVAPTPTPTDTPTPTPTPMCALTPLSGCHPPAPGKCLLLLKNASDDTKDKLIWKWRNSGPGVIQSDFGDPTSTTSYVLCLYAGTATASVAIPAGADWRRGGTTGYVFHDSTGSPDGVQTVTLKGGSGDRPKAFVKGKGTKLPDVLVPPLSLPVIVQFVNTENGCFSVFFDTDGVFKNNSEEFKGKNTSYYPLP